MSPEVRAKLDELMKDTKPFVDGDTGVAITDKDEIIALLKLSMMTIVPALAVTNQMLKYFAGEHGEVGHVHNDGSACHVAYQVETNESLLNGTGFHHRPVDPMEVH